MTQIKISKALIPIVGLLCLFPFFSAAFALASGLMIAVFLGNPYPTKNYIHKILTWSVIGLGFGMNLEVVARVGLQGFGYTLVSILLVLIIGFILQKMFQVESESGLLITVGTAICGGSAIAAVTSVIKAKPQSTSIALGTVFILNSVSLILFPYLGHLLHMDERAFGLWSALAIHDTSSVVGATLSYGPHAAEVGTTVKLARALWIVPVCLGIGFIKQRQNTTEKDKIKKPWFILGFLIAAALVTWIPDLQPAGHWIETVARRTLVFTLFLIGLGLSKETLKQVGFRPLLLGVVLWIIVASLTLLAIQSHWIT